MPYIFTIGKLQPLKERYSPIAIGDISKVSKKEWEEHWRQHGSGWKNPSKDNIQYLERAYGGSDMSIIADISNFTPKIELWAAKTGVKMAIQKKEKSAACRRGDLYETPTAKKYMQIRGMEGNKDIKAFVEGKIIDTDGNFIKDKNFKEVINPYSMYMFRDGRRNPDGSLKYPWALANCDGFVFDHGISGGLEIKTTTFLNRDVIENEWKQGIIPKYYLYQIVYYMGILNLQFWDIICSWGQDYNECSIIRFYRDYELEDKIFSMVEEFDEYVEQGIQPDTSTSKGDQLLKYYLKLFGPIPEGSNPVELPEKMRGTVNKCMDIDDEISNLEKKLKEKKQEKAKLCSEIYPVLKNAKYGQFKLDDCTTVNIKIKVPMHRPVLDLERLKAEHPDIIIKYQTFDSTAFRKAESILNKEYTLPAEVNTDKLPEFTLSKSIKTA